MRKIFPFFLFLFFICFLLEPKNIYSSQIQNMQGNVKSETGFKRNQYDLSKDENKYMIRWRDYQYKPQDPPIGRGENLNNETSLYSDWFNKTFLVPDLNDDNAKRKNINMEIMNGSSKIKYSLYDRFGSNIQYVPYFGEKYITTDLIDLFYRGIKNNKLKFQFKLKWLFEHKSVELNNIVYKGRPRIVSETSYLDGKKDPRREVFAEVQTSGGDAQIANFYLDISKGLFHIFVFLWQPDLGDINNSLNDLVKSEEYGSFKKAMNALITLLTIIMMFKLIPYIIRAIKEQRVKEFISVVASGIMSMIFLFIMINNINLFGTLANNYQKVITEVFSNDFSNGKSEVSSSDLKDNRIPAAIFEKVIFQPWVKGMFDNNKYKDMAVDKYDNNNGVNGISIPLGAGKESKNWAALAYSCQSPYHIDAIKNDVPTPSAVEWSKINQDTPFPVAMRMPGNKNIYVDNFRWLDSKLKVSYSKYDTKTGYKDTRSYKTNFLPTAIESNFLVMLLFPIGIILFKRFLSLLYVFLTAIRWLYASIRGCIDPGGVGSKYGTTLKSMLIPWYHYVWFTIMAYIMIFLYCKLPSNFVSHLFWIAFSIFFITSSRPPSSYTEAVQRFHGMTNKIKNGASAVKNKVKRWGEKDMKDTKVFKGMK